MVKEIIKDEFFLKQKSKSCTKEDLYIANELLETIQAYKEQCVGMAANMIGVRMQIIVFDNESTYRTMFNPEIIKKSGPYDTEASVFLFSTALINASAIRPSKYNGNPPNFQLALKSLSVGLHRSFSMKSIIAMAC